MMVNPASSARPGILQGLGRLWAVCCLLVGLAGLPGCLSPVALNHAALAYNRATADALSEQILLNIARAKHNDPLHFSGIANIAATFLFQVNAGVTPALTGDASKALLPLFGAGAAENPTVSIIPMDGEEFTRRMLTPISETKMTLLLRQNIDIDLLLRLLTLEYRYLDNGHEIIYHNRPRNADDYTAFRQMVVHLSSIQDQDELFAEPLTFERSWALPCESITAEHFSSLEKEYQVSINLPRKECMLSKQIVGRTVITNYPLSSLSTEERVRLNDEVEQNAPNDLFIDIRPGYPGGQFPMHGKFRLRSFSNILYFIGRSLNDEPEKPIQPDTRTPPISENPPFTLEILESSIPSMATEESVFYKGSYYAVSPDKSYPWNKSAFRLLAQLFQMTFSELPRNGIPITIAK